MSDRVYFTGTDARLLFLNHPEQELNGALDAAHYVLSAGQSPVHIWNYARQKDGGAPFDDTAIGNHVAELQVVMNQQKFEDTERLFLANPNVGDARLEYDSVGDWGERVTAGYELLEGKVGSTGEEVTLRNATFPTITLTFKEAVPLVGESQQPGDPGPAGVLEEDGDPSTRRVSFWPVEAFYIDSGVRKDFNPERGNAPDGDPLDPGQFVAFRRRQEQYFRVGGEHASAQEWAEFQTYVAPFLEVSEPGQPGRRLYAWSTSQASNTPGFYRKTDRTSPNERTPILNSEA